MALGVMDGDRATGWSAWMRPVLRAATATPGAAAQRYADVLQAPGKQLVWFENSAHTPHVEEPGRFRDLLLDVRASQLAATPTRRSQS